MSSLPSKPASSLRERLSLRREDRKTEKASPEPEATQAYLDAAAVLIEFNPDRIQPARPVADTDVRAALSSFSQVVVSGNQVRWSLNQGARKQVLQRLGTSEAISKALEANSERPSTPEQRVYELLLTGRWDYVLLNGERQLAAALQATEWLHGVLGNLPDPDELRRRLDYARFVAPFERLAGEGFVGRTLELQKLHDYVGVRELRSSTEALTQAFRGWLLKPKRGPLLVHGPGGVGKSALIARFILDQDSSRLAFGGFPVIYIDFDNSSLQLDHPETLVKEALRQVSLQYPEVSDMQMDFLPAYERFVAGQTDLPPSSGSSLERVQAQRFQAAMAFVEEWTGRLTRVRADVGAPFLIVFDTFEEVVGRNRLAIEQILTLCNLLQEVYPQARPVICGRALDTSFGDDLERMWDKLEVSDFDPAAAQAYLTKLGVSDPEIAQTIVKQLGGSPLTLKLAAEAIARGVTVRRNAGFQDLQTRSWLLFSASETVIQGQLYERILGHIRNTEVPEVRQLAYPGLVLRRVTPEIISEVLAVPCKLNLPSDPESREQAAQKLFDALRRETFLVDPRGVNSLRHRTDIRRVMLDMIEKRNQGLVRTIQESAVTYYFKSGTTPEDRAEEIYHRLKLGQDPASVSERWMEGAGDYLGDAILEVPPRGSLFLASRLGVKLKDEDNLYKEAGLEEWELFTARKVKEATTSRKAPEEILAMLHERSERSARSPLFELEADVLMNTGRQSEAVQVLESAVHSVAATGDRRFLGSLLDTLAFVRASLGQYDLSDELYQRVADIARDAEDRVFLLATMLNRVNFAIRDPQRLQEVIPQLSQVFLAARDEELRAVKSTAFSVLSVASPAQGPMILRAIEAGMFDELLASQSGLPRVRQLLSVLFQQSAANPEAVQKVAKLLFATAATM
jgi:tetratricopeptide (TPR) repeat protein